MKYHPLARNSNLVLQHFGDELLIYDVATNKAVCLNNTAAFVWQACNGKNTIPMIAETMSTLLGEFVSEDLVWLALDDLDKDGLLQGGSCSDHRFEGLSRREIIRKVGFASMVGLPMVSALIAPPASMAQSGLGGFGSPCTMDGQCASNHCVLGTTCCRVGSNGNAAPGANVDPCGTAINCAASSSAQCCSANATFTVNPTCPGAGQGDCVCDPF
ncbi:MAG: PqqD family protein [Pyrinomonadaceae bacterium]|nr:PqqD family protein [Pyrinomonadaceae bacterium]